MNITLRQIRAFQAVAEAGSFTRAADHLNLTQAAVSTLIRELEQGLEARLLDRTTRRVSLTDSGAAFLDASHSVVAGLAQACRDVRDHATGQRGRLRLAVPPLLAATWLPPLLQKFAAAYPQVSLSLADVPTARIIARTRAGQVDAGIGTIPPSQQGLTRHHLFTDALMLFEPARPGHRSDTPARWSDLRARPLIGLREGSGVRALTDQALTKSLARSKEGQDDRVAPDIAVEQMSSALALVAAGLGHAVLPAYARTFARKAGPDLDGIHARPLGPPTVQRDVVLIVPTGRSLSPTVAAFLKLAQTR